MIKVRAEAAAGARAAPCAAWAGERGRAREQQVGQLVGDGREVALQLRHVDPERRDAVLAEHPAVPPPVGPEALPHGGGEDAVDLDERAGRRARQVPLAALAVGAGEGRLAHQPLDAPSLQRPAQAPYSRIQAAARQLVADAPDDG